MKAHGGHIVQISSTMDSLATPNLAAYTASKWACTGFSECLRLELQDTKVKIVVVRPWIVETPLFNDINYWNHWIKVKRRKKEHQFADIFRKEFASTRDRATSSIVHASCHQVWIN